MILIILDGSKHKSMKLFYRQKGSKNDFLRYAKIVSDGVYLINKLSFQFIMKSFIANQRTLQINVIVCE